MTEQLTPEAFIAALIEVVQDPAPIAARLVCAPDVVEALHGVALPEPASEPWRPTPLASMTGLPVQVDVELPDGAWRLLNAAGDVVREGVIAPARG
jgi:hypothetical protein